VNRLRLPLPLLATIGLILAGCGSDPPGKSAASPSPRNDHRKSADDLTPLPDRDDEPPPFAPLRKVVITPAVTKPAPKPQPVFRPSDDRPKHDDARLAKLGIHKYESKRLILYTDVDPKIAKTLPPVLDQAYPAWEAYFGKLPPNRERSPFQVTGYVMKDVQRFRDAKLIPPDFPALPPGGGRHRGYRFWMHDSPWDYYRRHLLVHESTHCFMYATREPAFPTWYMEGMAEFFGTHEVIKAESGKRKAGKSRPPSAFRLPPSAFVFGVMPQRFEDFVGSGRIEFIQQDCTAGRPLSLQDVVALKPADFRHNQAYAWSWALCKFLDSHPRYGKRFRELRTLEFAADFRNAFAKLVRDESPHIAAEWQLFARGLVYGYDTTRAAIDIRPGKPLGELQLPVTFELQTNRGWQSTGVWLDKGDAVRITAAGRFELARKPKPWISEPQGISFTYFHGRPLGEVTAVLLPDRVPLLDGRRDRVPKSNAARRRPSSSAMLPITPIARGGILRAAIKGTVYVRVNDSFAWLGDNKGTVRVTIERAAE
jgi:hypothetical protein